MDTAVIALIIHGDECLLARQPWPFSNSVMIGYNAVVVDKSVKLDNEELEDARWFTRDDIKH